MCFIIAEHPIRVAKFIGVFGFFFFTDGSRKFLEKVSFTIVDTARLRIFARYLMMNVERHFERGVLGSLLSKRQSGVFSHRKIISVAPITSDIKKRRDIIFLCTLDRE